MSKDLVGIISGQTKILLFNVGTMLKTCDMEASVYGMPVWKHAYHMLHSLDRWFISPERYEEPPFHVPGLNSLDEPSARSLSKDELAAYFDGICAKINRYLKHLTDDMLPFPPEGCRHTRLALILGQFRHLYCHLGIVNCLTIQSTGEWPRVVGMDADFSGEYSLFE